MICKFFLNKIAISSFRDDDDLDYPNPASMGPNVTNEEEEMKEDETIEQFEDRVLNKRAAHLNTVLKTRLGEESEFIIVY